MPPQSALFPDSHPLPDRLARIFEPLCRDTEHVDLDRLTTQVIAHAAQIRQATRRNEFLDAGLADQIADLLCLLLSDVTHQTPQQRALVVGAARYFTDMNDADSDLNSILGLDDDVEVLNHVLDLLGHTDLKVKL